MAQDAADKRERYRVETRMQWRFNIEPRREAVVLPLQRHFAGEASISRTVDREGDADTVCVEEAGRELEVTDDEDDDGQRHVNDGCNDKPAQWVPSQATD